MKREQLRYILVGFALFLIMSMTLSEGARDVMINGSFVLNVPAKPSSTVYVQGVDNMNKYIKRGYQVQEVVDAGHHHPRFHYFLMIKYQYETRF